MQQCFWIPLLCSVWTYRSNCPASSLSLICCCWKDGLQKTFWQCLVLAYAMLRRPKVSRMLGTDRFELIFFILYQQWKFLNHKHYLLSRSKKLGFFVLIYFGRSNFLLLVIWAYLTKVSYFFNIRSYMVLLCLTTLFMTMFDAYFWLSLIA